MNTQILGRSALAFLARARSAQLRLTSIALLSSAILLAPIAAKADHYYSKLRLQFIAIAAQLDLSITHDLYVDTIDDGDGDVITLNLRGGTSYIIVGLCDENCSDLDMAISSPSGYISGYDTDYNDYTLIPITPRTSGNYRLAVKMQSCSVSSCDYGIGVFRR